MNVLWDCMPLPWSLSEGPATASSFLYRSLHHQASISQVIFLCYATCEHTRRAHGRWGGIAVSWCAVGGPQSSWSDDAVSAWKKLASVFRSRVCFWSTHSCETQSHVTGTIYGAGQVQSSPSGALCGFVLTVWCCPDHQNPSMIIMNARPFPTTRAMDPCG